MPIVQNLPTYVKDTNHALNILNNFTISGNKPKIFTMDISALYTSIPNNDAVLAVKHFLDKRPNPYFDTEIILRLTELVLNLNTFQFNGEFYSQTGGVAMGTKMGPSFACLFVGYLEEKMFAEYSGPVPDLYKRYIDDVFGVSSNTDQELQSFINFVSSYHPAIKYTFTISESELSFLDILCKVTDSSIDTSIFYKPTDAHCYLNYSSCHPKSCKDAIPKSIPKTVVDRALNSVSRKNRTCALTPKRKSNSDRVPLVLTYHPHNIAIRNILLKNFSTIVLKDPMMANIFPSPPLTAFRRGKSLREHLVSSTYKSKQISTDYRGTRRCNRPRCVTCPFTFESDEIQGPDISFAILGGFSCVTENLIYAVVCSRCKKSLYRGNIPYTG